MSLPLDDQPSATLAVETRGVSLSYAQGYARGYRQNHPQNHSQYRTRSRPQSRPLSQPRSGPQSQPQPLVLDDVDLRVPRGVLGAIVGPNGAGKSTLLKVLLGLDGGHRGDAFLLGRSSTAARHLVGYVPQRSTVDWDFPANALDVVTMGLFRELGPVRRAGRKARDRAMEALSEVGLEEFARRQIGQLSGGQQQRVFLARALVQRAELYLLDEPFAGVDAASEAALMRVLRMLNDAGSTVLAVHHDLNTLSSYFDWLALLNVRLHAQGPLEEVFTAGPLQATYGGRLPLFALTADPAGTAAAAAPREPVGESELHVDVV